MGTHQGRGKRAAWGILGILACLFGACIDPAFAGDRKTAVKTFEASATYTAGTNYSSGFLVEAYQEGMLLIAASGVSGTPTLSVYVQTSDDNSTYYDHSRAAVLTAVSGETAYAVTNFGKYLRTKAVLSGETECELTYEIKGVFKN